MSILLDVETATRWGRRSAVHTALDLVLIWSLTYPRIWSLSLASLPLIRSRIDLKSGAVDCPLLDVRNPGYLGMGQYEKGPEELTSDPHGSVCSGDRSS